MLKKKGVILAATITLIGSMILGMIASTVSVVQQQEGAAAGYSTSSGGGSGDGQKMVEVALGEMGTSGGDKYRLWYLGAADGAPWCATFVSWCGEQLGLIEAGIIPKFQGCSPGVAWFEERGEFIYTPAHGGTSYTPKAGDIIFFTWSGNLSWLDHVGIVQYAENNMVVTVEGNSGDAVQQNSYNLDNPCIVGYATPSYPNSGGGSDWGNAGAPLINGQTIMIPSGLGTVRTYMGWQCITAPSSMQYKLRQDAGMNFDSEGFGRIGNRYVIACTTTYGTVGDRVDFYLENGTKQETIIGDIKNPNDPGCNKWGHLEGDCIIEYVVDKDTWYSSGHANPGTTYCHPEWRQSVVKAVNRGSWWSERGKDPADLMK